MQVHDIEDLCRVGRQVKSCAYFASRKYAGGALVSLPWRQDLTGLQLPHWQHGQELR